MEVGQIVFSKNGRDKGKAMIVLNIESEYVYIVDGKHRLLEKPKKKKIKHIQPTNIIINLGEVSGCLKNADFRKWLLEYTRQS